MADEPVVGPGPCPPEGCPPPTAIDCIEVTKVYDFCFQSDTREMIPFPIPHSCGTVPPGSTATATVTNVTCTATNVTPIPGSGGFANVTLTVVADLSITITAPDGTTLCSFIGQLPLSKTVTLCAPTGVTITCSAPATATSGTMILNGDVVTNIMLCLLIQSTALVKLLVPTYGFCVPAPCVVSPSPPFTCPPSPLFPPQCGPVIPTTTPTAMTTITGLGLGF